MAKVAVITMVQACDRPHAISALKSVASLNDPDIFRLVLLNDVTDHDFAAELASAANCEVIQAGRNLGVAGGRNKLITEAISRGAEFILSVDDDILLPADFASILRAEFHALAAHDDKVGILTPVTLDFNRVASLFFSAATIEKIENGESAPVPTTQQLREVLKEEAPLKSRDIYHMGIRNWRGAYLFSGSTEDKTLQELYGLKLSEQEGPLANWRHTSKGVESSVYGGDPLPIDTAPGGISMYSRALVEDIGLHDCDFNPFGYEDADFALRARASGYQNYCIPNALAIHDIAARLHQRRTSVLQATQGKMAGSFARKHLKQKESAAGFFSVSRRAANTLTARGRAQRERKAELISVARLEGFAAYIGNAIHYLLPKINDAEQFDLERSIEQFHDIIQVITPANLSLSVTRSQNAVTVQNSAGGFKATASASVSEDQRPCLTFAIESISIPADISPEIFQAITDDGVFQFSLSGSLSANAENTYHIKQLKIKVRQAFTIDATAIVKRTHASSDQVAPLEIQQSEILVSDKGALARILMLFAEIECMSPADFMKAISRKMTSNPLRLFLNGDADAVKLNAHGILDGVPGPLKINVTALPPPDTIANDGVRQLSKVTSIPVPSQPAPVKTPRRRQVKTILKDLKALPARITAQDPSVAPFPEAYNPSAATKFTRKLRYISAGKGLPLSQNEARLLSFKNKNLGERAFIIGNGPSLNKIDLRKLKNETTFGVNAIYLNKEKMGFLPTHHIVEDVFVAEDRALEINALEGPNQWFGNYLRYCLTPKSNVCWLNIACDYRNYPGFPHFSDNAARIVWVGGTVSYIAMQLAYFMGFKSVYLVGFDHSYSVPKEAEVKGRAITSTSDDPNHFHPDYFGKGYRWHDPRVDRMEQAYIRARAMYERAGRKLFNATVGGHLEVFDRVNFDDIV
ncbi:MAG: 6-hydroxymethylpterin diphosphokinase MptE-like protein [Pseudomonadota bacterium]